MQPFRKNGYSLGVSDIRRNSCRREGTLRKKYYLINEKYTSIAYLMMSTINLDLVKERNTAITNQEHRLKNEINKMDNLLNWRKAYE